jgi:hypothetical protein
VEIKLKGTVVVMKEMLEEMKDKNKAKFEKI